MTLHPQWEHSGATAWIAHSKLSKVLVCPSDVAIWNDLS